MRVIRDNLEVCDDCIVAIANADFSGMDDATEQAVKQGIQDLQKNGLYLVAGDEDFEFSQSNCDCCGGLPGRRYSASLLGE